MTLKSAFRLTILGLAGYGGRTLWNRHGSQLATRVARKNRRGDGPSARRINERSELTIEESAVGSDDPVAQATAILTDSDERSRLPRTADGIEHRHSQDTVER
jgi:hypothetical protein